MPEVPTPGVNGQVVSSPALHASMSISSLAPAAKMLGWAWSTATAGSFCLFWENGLEGLPTDTRVSPPWVAEATAGMTRAATKATNPATMMCRPNRMAPLPRGPAGPTDVPASHPKTTPQGRSQLRPALPARTRPGQQRRSGLSRTLPAPSASPSRSQRIPSGAQENHRESHRRSVEGCSAVLVHGPSGIAPPSQGWPSGLMNTPE
jgi:hypothetical protein